MTTSPPRSADVVIVGAGLAGASTAYHLAARGVRDIVLLEREAAPGAHASGKNAGLVRRLVEDPVLLPFAVRGAALLDAPPAEMGPRPPLRRIGSVLLVSEEEAPRYDRLAATGACSRRITAAELARLAPDLAPGTRGQAFHTPEDAVIDPRAILDFWLDAARARGVRLETGIEARALVMEGGRVAGVETSRGRILAPMVVDAAGPWAGELSRAAGLAPPPVRSYRRHIHATVAGARGRASPDAPFVWDVAAGFYYRPDDAGGLQLSPCEEDPVEGHGESLRAATAAPDPRAETLLRAKLAAGAPGLAGLPFGAARACMRTFAPDRRYVIGPEPRLPGLVYVACLGGHGLTTSGPVGEMGALAVLEPERLPAAFLPARFASPT